jgi:type III pantothenate kinase
MLILLDAGNTRLKWGAWADGAWLVKGALDNARVADGLATTLVDYAPSWIGVSCVAGEAVRAAIADYARAAGVEPYWLRATAEMHGLRNGYHAPETLGADRFAALYACLVMGLAPCVVATAGTALTVDALASDGLFLGGMIAPGVGLMRHALVTGTAGLANSPGVCQDFPRATVDAIESGIDAALAGPVATMRERLTRMEGSAVATVLSGGDAARLARALPFTTRLIDDLVLEGLLCLAKRLDTRDA